MIDATEFFFKKSPIYQKRVIYLAIINKVMKICHTLKMKYTNYKKRLLLRTIVFTITKKPSLEQSNIWNYQ